MRANFTILLGIPTKKTEEHCLLLVFGNDFNRVRNTGTHPMEENTSRRCCVECKKHCPCGWSRSPSPDPAIKTHSLSFMGLSAVS